MELVATAASVVTHSSYAEVTGIKHGRLGRWTDGVAVLRADRPEFGGAVPGRVHQPGQWPPQRSREGTGPAHARMVGGADAPAAKAPGAATEARR